VFTIGAFARLAGVSPKVLRTYDALGLFHPAWVDRLTGYRHYSPAQLPDLRRIAALRGVGLGLTEIRRLIAGGADLQDALGRRRTELEAERAEIDRRLAALDIRVRGGGGDGIHHDDRAGIDVVVRPLAAELIAIRTVGSDEDDSDAFYDLESHVRDEGRRARRPPGAITQGPGPEWAIYVPITGRIRPTPRIREERLAACRAATLLHRGPYDGLAAVQRDLERWAAGAGWRPAGPLRIVYLQFGAEPELRVPPGYVPGYVVDGSADFLTELQLPVSPAD
jgi:DNA-binding transcriptional MerR regulator